jgi:hypothetical protein
MKLPDFNTRWLHYAFLAGAVAVLVWMAFAVLQTY